MDVIRGFRNALIAVLIVAAPVAVNAAEPDPFDGRLIRKR